jgi:reactive intermediate/imine deaminase
VTPHVARALEQAGAWQAQRQTTVLSVISVVPIWILLGEKQAMTDEDNVRFLNPPTLATPPGYTHVVAVTNARMIYVAGQVALDPAGHLVGPGDFRAQATQVFENLKAALEAVGTDFDDVIKLNIYVLDMAHLPILREIRDAYVNTQRLPASTAVQVSRLAREEFLLEIEAVAAARP